jgi:hypothetical protein
MLERVVDAEARVRKEIISGDSGVPARWEHKGKYGAEVGHKAEHTPLQTLLIWAETTELHLNFCYVKYYVSLSFIRRQDFP